MPTILTDPGERKASAHKALWRICECPALAPYLRELLCSRDVQGYTPFMQAVCGRAYRAATQLLDTTQRIAKVGCGGGEDGYGEWGCSKRVRDSLGFFGAGSLVACSMKWKDAPCVSRIWTL